MQSPTPRSVSLRQVQLRAVLATFGFLENILKIQHMEPRFPGNLDFQKSKKFVWLWAVLANLGFANISIFREFLRENELLSKTILAYLSGAQKKISWHCPFKLPPIYIFNCWLAFLKN